MVKTVIPTKDYAEVTKAYIRKKTQYYYLNLLPEEQEDMTICLQSLFNHKPTEEDKENVLSEYANICRTVLRKNIEDYDCSDAVNAFSINGVQTWLDKATRVGLANSLSIEKNAGKTETTLYLNGNSIVCPIDKAQEILSQIELYALDCYRQTEAHKKTIEEITDPAELEKYDFTKGYPEKLEFKTSED